VLLDEVNQRSPNNGSKQLPDLTLDLISDSQLAQESSPVDQARQFRGDLNEPGWWLLLRRSYSKCSPKRPALLAEERREMDTDLA
jgi:hypothetical protein